MMQKLLTKYWLTVHIGLLLLASWGVLTQPRLSGYVSLLWLSLLALEAMAVLPAVRRNETLSDARQRVGRALLWDPFLYLALALALFALAQWLNSGIALVYLPDADVWRFSEPAVAWAPFSVERSAAAAALAVWVACAIGGGVLRQAVSRAGKRFLLQGAAAVSGGLALRLAWQVGGGVEPVAALARQPGAANAGSFFGFWLLLGLGAYLDAQARRQRGVEALFVLAVVGNLVGLLLFAQALVVAVYGALTLALFGYALVYLNAHVPKAVQLKLFLVVVAVVVCATLGVVVVFPGNAVLAKLQELSAFSELVERLAELKAVRSAAALQIWQEHPWAGVGVDGFRHYVGTVVEGRAWSLVKAEPGAVRNDCLQFLCEYGALGFGLLVAAAVSLMVPVCYRARLAWLYGTGEGHDGRLFLLRLSPLVVTGTLATALCFTESWIASPFRSPALLVSWVFVMAAMPAFLPAKAQRAA